MKYQESRTDEYFNFVTGENHHYKVFLRDYTPYIKYVESLKPEKTKGEKFQSWSKAMQSIEKYWRNSPYRIIVEYWGDDDMIEVSEFENKTDAENIFNELITCPICPEPHHFKEWGFG